MERTTVLITGCSSGIGLGLAARLAADATGRFKGKGVTLCRGGRHRRGSPRQLVPGGGLWLVPAAQLGSTAAPRPCSLPPVYATMRDLAKGDRLLERLGGCCPDTLEVLQLDVTDPCSLAAAAQRVQEQQLDVLVCNAGVGLMGPLETCSDQAMKTVFDVNLFGAVRTIQAFLPAMKRRRAGRIIISSSIGGLQGGTWPCCGRTPGTLGTGSCGEGTRCSGCGSAPGLPFNSVYCASKFAVEGLCESLAIVLQPFNIHLTLVECGPVNTSFLANLQHPDPEGSELQGLDAETRDLYHRYLRHCQSLFHDAAQEVEDVLPVSPCRLGVRGSGTVRVHGWPWGHAGDGSDPSVVAGVPGGHQHPLPSPALRHHPALRPTLAPEAGQPRQHHVRPGHARLRVRPRRGRWGPALSRAAVAPGEPRYGADPQPCDVRAGQGGSVPPCHQ
ncbi:17-beta-hydroxysteroid dehydrogenase type 1 isoform X2 [Grus americana]|uniref:17-beta-hydroxysteroid dehydrogenase type 1 isoform X2 n=1 Tax=Grus americana TaxID=9117 RepID=UPI002407CEBF|nr:17-beta-hydroxysteroid dehydrogenase type 1 isoform X2 [Grus americana]